MDDILIRYLHFIGILLLTSMLVAENILLKPELSRSHLKQLALIDGLYGLGAMLTLVGGLLLWLVVGKPQVFYSTNPLFHAKLGVFIVVAILSIYPTVFLLRNRAAKDVVERIKVPPLVLYLKRVELILLAILPLLAILMAKGVGLNG